MTEEMVVKRRRPWLAAILAFVTPGLGHLYGGRIWWAATWLVIMLAALGSMIPLMIYWEGKPFNVIVPLSVLAVLFLLHIGHAWWTARRQPTDFRLRWNNRWYYYIIWIICGFVLFSYVRPVYGRYRAFSQPSVSMESAILLNDKFMADMAAYDDEPPSRGDVVIFVWPVDGKTLYIKRCVALPGDTVEIKDKRLLINGAPAQEPSTITFTDFTQAGEQVIHPRRSGGDDSRDNWGPFEVGAGMYFMLGDNRDNSYDSRYWGCVPGDHMLGKAMRIYFSSDRDRIGLGVE